VAPALLLLLLLLLLPAATAPASAVTFALPHTSATLQRADATADAERPLYCHPSTSEGAVVSSEVPATGVSTATKTG
jgi:hypothetical protein